MTTLIESLVFGAGTRRAANNNNNSNQPSGFDASLTAVPRALSEPGKTTKTASTGGPKRQCKSASAALGHDATAAATPANAHDNHGTSAQRTSSAAQQCVVERKNNSAGSLVSLRGIAAVPAITVANASGILSTATKAVEHDNNPAPTSSVAAPSTAHTAVEAKLLAVRARVTLGGAWTGVEPEDLTAHTAVEYLDDSADVPVAHCTGVVQDGDRLAPSATKLVADDKDNNKWASGPVTSATCASSAVKQTAEAKNNNEGVAAATTAVANNVSASPFSHKADIKADALDNNKAGVQAALRLDAAPKTTNAVATAISSAGAHNPAEANDNKDPDASGEDAAHSASPDASDDDDLSADSYESVEILQAQRGAGATATRSPAVGDYDADVAAVLAAADAALADAADPNAAAQAPPAAAPANPTAAGSGATADFHKSAVTINHDAGATIASPASSTTASADDSTLESFALINAIPGPINMAPVELVDMAATPAPGQRIGGEGTQSPETHLLLSEPAASGPFVIDGVVVVDSIIDDNANAARYAHKSGYYLPLADADGDVILYHVKYRTCLGRGGFGRVDLVEVFLGEERGWMQLALKCIQPSQGNGGLCPTFLREAAFGEFVSTLSGTDESQLAAPSVVICGTRGQWGYIGFEYCPEGSLGNLLGEVGEDAMPLWDALRITKQVLGTLAVLHKHGWIHRDIKPDNILVRHIHMVDHLAEDDHGNGDNDNDYESPENWIEVVVADYGLADSDGPWSARAGTMAYAAPEVRCGAVYDCGADIYSVGRMLYELIVGTLPRTQWRHEDIEFGAADFDHSRFTGSHGRELVNLVCALTAPNPGDRPTTYDAIDWVAGLEAELVAEEWARHESQQLAGTPAHSSVSVSTPPHRSLGESASLVNDDSLAEDFQFLHGEESFGSVRQQSDDELTAAPTLPPSPLRGSTSFVAGSSSWSGHPFHPFLPLPSTARLPAPSSPTTTSCSRSNNNSNSGSSSRSNSNSNSGSSSSSSSNSNSSASNEARWRLLRAQSRAVRPLAMDVDDDSEVAAASPAPSPAPSPPTTTTIAEPPTANGGSVDATLDRSATANADRVNTSAEPTDNGSAHDNIAAGADDDVIVFAGGNTINSDDGPATDNAGSVVAPTTEEPAPADAGSSTTATAAKTDDEPATDNAGSIKVTTTDGPADATAGAAPPDAAAANAAAINTDDQPATDNAGSVVTTTTTGGPATDNAGAAPTAADAANGTDEEPATDNAGSLAGATANAAKDEASEPVHPATTDTTPTKTVSVVGTTNNSGAANDNVAEPVKVDGATAIAQGDNVSAPNATNNDAATTVNLAASGSHTAAEVEDTASLWSAEAVIIDRDSIPPWAANAYRLQRVGRFLSRRFKRSPEAARAHKVKADGDAEAGADGAVPADAEPEAGAEAAAEPTAASNEGARKLVRGCKLARKLKKLVRRR